MNKIARYINEHINGSAFSTDRILNAYATDRSVLKIKPKAVVVPANAGDIRKTLRFADQLAIRKVHVPVTVRGAGRGKTGACLTSGIVLSMEKMNQISEIDIRQRLVRCQAGVTLGQLNSALALHGLILPISADPTETIGGLIANGGIYYTSSNSPSRSLRDYLEKAEYILPSGDLFQTEQITPKMIERGKGQRTREANLYRNLNNFLSDKKDLIATEIDASTHVLPTGYASIALAGKENNTNIIHLLFGSQGTLAVISEVILRCDFLAEAPTYFFATFKNIESARDFASKATALAPATLDIYDLAILSQDDAGKTLRPFSAKATDSGFLVVVSLYDIKPRKRRSKLRHLSNFAENTGSAHSTPETIDEFTELHSILLTYLNDSPRSTRLPLVDGAYVPEDRFGAYLAGLKNLEKKHSVDLSVFGSYLTSTYSVRPEINLSSVTGRQFVLSFLRDYHELLVGLGGSLTGDAPEGRTEAIATTPSLDPSLVKAYEDLKEIFDPNNVLNPGVKHDVNLRSVIHNLRTSYDSGIIT